MKQFFFKTIICLIFLALVDGLFFAFADYRNCPDSMWAALIGINIGYLSLLLIPLAAPKQNGQRVLSGTLYLIGSLYFISELIAGLIFLFWPTVALVWPVCVQSIIFGIFLIVLLSSVLGNDATVASINEQRQQSCIVRNRADEVNAILTLISDGECRKLVNKCYFELRNSPLKSSPEVSSLEQEIDQHIMLLNSYVTENNIEGIKSSTAKIRVTLGLRNNKLKHLTQY